MRLPLHLSPVHLLASVVVAMAAAASSSCAEPDPTYGDPGGIQGKTLPHENAAPATSAGGPSATFGTVYSASANPAPPAKSFTSGHAGKQGVPAIGDAVDCMQCHKGGGTTPAFSFGGRINSAAGAPVANADVIVLSSDGAAKLGPVKSDAEGFFWFSSTNTIPDKGIAWIRDGKSEVKMSTPLGTATGGGCTAPSCHGGTTPKITLE